MWLRAFKEIKIHCERRCYLRKKTIGVEIGPVSSYNMTLLKIWLAVFCCMTTSTTSIKVMEDYSTIALVQAFTRFACEVGYPQFMYIHEGSQLV